MSNDKPIDVELPTAPDMAPRFARLRASWNAAWAEGGFLYHRWEDIRQARHAGWHGVANWLKATGLLAGACLLIVMLDTAGDIASAALKGISASPALSAGDAHGLWGTVDHPIRVYLSQQAAHLAVTPAALYTFWQIAGLLGLIGGFAGNAGARIAWLLWGCGSLAMVWSASPAGGRTAATGLAALMWALASIIALRGLSLRPVVHNHIAAPVFQPEFRPELHLHATSPTPAGRGDDFDDVHQLLQR
ncbi:hypothetical protein [Streptomyces hygroscopicus]|uniref:hypothetical protein n=1 Tax=Streptomyces hygroscopicus TaxID=1912 RepID=UPI00078379EF|nr:hypothetical protein [Streptomyces hygroscopicus]